ncbi:MAG TPA: putative Ig domain-containing protein, partial [Aquabacterium sp.]|nr:putative Ig domain-containing protein [Aquabacterium sp.]
MRRLVLLSLTSLLLSCGGGGGGTSSPGSPSGLSYSSPQSLTLDTALTPLNPNVSGGVTSYSVSPPLPSGLTLDTATGQISGTPTVTSASATYRITATNAQGSTNFDLSLSVDYTQPFWVEPASSTVIGIGQIIFLYGAYKAHPSDAYPTYLNGTSVTWSSSNPSCAIVNNSGRITGVSACSTVITASYLGHSVQVPVQVSGNWITRNIAVTGQGTRTYSIYVPDFGSTPGPHPAMLSLHGGGGSAMIQASTSQLVKLAQAQKIYIAFLQGTGTVPTFNAGACCGEAKTNNVDDVTYARAVLDDMIGHDSIDTSHVYASGMSNGGMMSHRLACEMADRLAGITAVSGASAEFDQNLTH